MAEKEKTYSIDELERETGYSRRTISYYVLLGLLPKVGQRGPSTRYSRLFVDRLLFLREIRRRQHTGRFPSMSLEEIRDRILGRVPHDLIARVARGEEDPSVTLLWGGGEDEDDLASKKLSRDVKQTVLLDAAEEAQEMPDATLSAPAWVSMEAVRNPDAKLPKVMAELATDLRREAEQWEPEEREWTTVQVTEDLLLTVRSRKGGAVRLVRKVRNLLRKMLGE